eukprot:gene5095-biopygen17621
MKWASAPDATASTSAALRIAAAGEGGAEARTGSSGGGGGRATRASQRARSVRRRAGRSVRRAGTAPEPCDAEPRLGAAPGSARARARPLGAACTGPAPRGTLATAKE